MRTSSCSHAAPDPTYAELAQQLARAMPGAEMEAVSDALAAYYRRVPIPDALQLRLRLLRDIMRGDIDD